MASIRFDKDQYERLRAHLRGHLEQVAFTLAEFDAQSHVFAIKELIVVEGDALDDQRVDYIELGDDVQRAIIKRAWDSGLCLVEAHSHGDRGYAAFSRADEIGFAEWVPHLWWRLKGRPYAAIVMAGPEDFDAIAWVDGADLPEQVTHLDVIGGARLRPTGMTLKAKGGHHVV